MDILDNRTVKARKHHFCSWCGCSIDIGDEYTTSTMVEGGDIWTWRECGRCKEYVEEMYADDSYETMDGYTSALFGEFMYDRHPEVAKEWWIR